VAILYLSPLESEFRSVRQNIRRAGAMLLSSQGRGPALSAPALVPRPDQSEIINLVRTQETP